MAGFDSAAGPAGVVTGLIEKAAAELDAMSDAAGEIAPEVGDLTGDGIADLLLADPPGTGSSKLLVLDGKTGAIIQNPFAFDPLFGFGVFVGAN